MKVAAGIIAIGAIFFTTQEASAQLALGGLDLGFLTGGDLPVVGDLVGDLGLTLEGDADENHADATVGFNGGGAGGLGGLEDLIGLVPLAPVEQIFAELPPILGAAMELLPPVMAAVDLTTNATFGAIAGNAEDVMALLTGAVGLAPPAVGAATNLVTTVFGAIDGIGGPATGVLGNIMGP
jgi:hypothetical protein